MQSCREPAEGLLLIDSAHSSGHLQQGHSNCKLVPVNLQVMSASCASFEAPKSKTVPISGLLGQVVR